MTAMLCAVSYLGVHSRVPHLVPLPQAFVTPFAQTSQLYLECREQRRSQERWAREAEGQRDAPTNAC